MNGARVNERREFVAGLRRERERRGITLDEVAEQTKINVALLAGLERGDLTRWPTGIFRRSFVRGYAVTIGLDPDAVVNAFARFFPDTADGGCVTVPPFEHHAAGGDRDRLRLTLDSHPRPSMRVLGLRAAAAALDAVVIAACGVVGTLGGFPFAAVALAVAAVYFTVGTVLLEASPGWWLARRHVRVRPSVQDVDAELVLDAAADVDEAGARRVQDQPPVRPGRRERRPGRNDRQRVARGGARRVS